MTDKTQYCELCEAAQREIAELKAERFTMIDEAIAMVRELDNKFHELGEGSICAALGVVLMRLEFDIRAKYAAPICPTCGDKDGPWLPEKNYICEKCDRGE